MQPTLQQVVVEQRSSRGRVAAVLWSAVALLLALPLLLAPIIGWLYLTGHTP